jgi:hypothetical protein
MPANEIEVTCLPAIWVVAWIPSNVDTSALDSPPCGVVAVGRAVTWAAARGPGSGAADHAERIGPERCGWELRSRPRRTREMKR